MDITPLLEKDRLLITSYGDGSFQIGEDTHEGSVIVFPKRVVPWTMTDSAMIDADSLRPIIEAEATIDIVLLGCGPSYCAPPDGLAPALKEFGMVLEWMDSGAACRTFNILMQDGRNAAAAIIAV